MKPKSKIAIAAVLILAVIPVLMLVGAEIVLNSPGVKSELENIVGEALQMAFKIEGRIDIRVFPLISLVVNGVTVGIETAHIASADQIVIEPRLLPLWYRDIQLKEARIQHARLALDPNAIDKIVALINTEPDGPLPVESLAIESFAISDAVFNYADDQTMIEFNELNFRGDQIEIIKDREVIIDDIYKFFKAINFTGDMAARQISSRDFKVANLRAHVKNENGILTADPVMLQYVGSDTKLRASLDFRQAKSTFESTLNLSGLNLKALAGKYFPAVNLKSKVDITSELSAAGIELEKLVGYLSSPDQPAAQKPIPIKSVIVKAFTVAAKDLFYSNDTLTIQQAGLNLNGNRWALIENNRSMLADFVNILKATKINGRATIKSITLSDHIFENLRANISNDHGIITADPIELEYFGEQARLGLDWDLSKPAETIQLRIDMPDMNTGRFLKRSGGKDLLNGKLTIKAELEARGADSNTLVEKINGHIRMHGTNLTLKGVDFDRALDEFQKMGAYGFHDFAALITLGPLGPVVSHGYDQLDALEKMMAAKGDSTIEKIVSDWKVINGVAAASDVAFRTKRHRMAIAGRLDFPDKRFHEVTLAVVDPNGCILNKETVDGPFKTPEVKETSIVQRTVIRPLKSFLKSDCESFYSGSVAHPTAIQSN